MKQFTVNEKEAGQRLDKYLHKLLPDAPSSFLYKMLRKKNITLNGKKAEGKEKLVLGDTLTLFLSEDTISSFQGKLFQGKLFQTKSFQEEPFQGRQDSLSACCDEAYRKLKGIQVLYEDSHIIIMNKPSGILSQKAAFEDLSLNEWLLGYLLAKGDWNPEESAAFKPSVCNRLDRNTSGLVMGAKSIAGGQMLGSLLKSRRIRKFYRMLVKGRVSHEEDLEGYLVKDEESNTVRLAKKEEPNAAYIRTRYYPLDYFRDMTLVEAELITGKTHQLRIHLSADGHPLVGDYKYGDRSFNEKYKRLYHINCQLLCACRLEFPKMEAPFNGLNKKRIEIPLPKEFLRLMEHGPVS